MLIIKGADINCQDKDFYTPLHYASENGFNEIVELLLRNNALTDIKNF